MTGITLPTTRRRGQTSRENLGDGSEPRFCRPSLSLPATFLCGSNSAAERCREALRPAHPFKPQSRPTHLCTRRCHEPPTTPALAPPPAELSPQPWSPLLRDHCGEDEQKVIQYCLQNLYDSLSTDREQPLFPRPPWSQLSLGSTSTSHVTRPDLDP